MDFDQGVFIDRTTGKYVNVAPDGKILASPIDEQAIHISERRRPQQTAKPITHAIPVTPAKTQHLSFIPTNAQVVKFYKRSVYNKATNAYEDKDYIKIGTAGEQDQLIDRPVNSSDVNKYPDLWRQYINNQEQVTKGTPLTLIYPNTPAKIDTLKALSIHTVEHLAALNDTAINAISGHGLGTSDVKRAQQYLYFQENEKEMFDLKQAVASKDERIRQLEKQLAAISQPQLKKRVQPQS